MTLVVVGATTNRAANLQLLVPLIMGGFVVGAMVGALDPFGRRGATDQDCDLAAGQNDFLEAREVFPPDDAPLGVTYQVSGSARELPWRALEPANRIGTMSTSTTRWRMRANRRARGWRLKDEMQSRMS